jgi:2-polyprenyl-3-methyl-5-hydroxy-6-metoxy-1,4-benzoquinol methylase
MTEHNSWQTMWDERYRIEDYAYGTTPNEYLRENLSKLPCGNILFPAEGEGRNAVFAATQGWNVSAFDISVEGQKKAYQLANKNNVTIDYHVGNISDLPFTMNQFDAVALIYAHFPPNERAQIHARLQTLLRNGGILLFEGFSKNHLEYRKINENVGGPKDIDFLFSIEELQHDFSDFEFISLEEKVIQLNEGLFHNGIGSVIRCMAIKT